MARLSIDVTPQEKKQIKIKSARTGLAQAEIVRRLLFAWLDGEIDIPQASTEEWRGHAHPEQNLLAEQKSHRNGR